MTTVHIPYGDDRAAFLVAQERFAGMYDPLPAQAKQLRDAGASGLVYKALSKDYYGPDSSTPSQLIIKECYPLEVAHLPGSHERDQS